MNRKKKINQVLKAKAKKANAKLHGSNKPKYIAKSDRMAAVDVLQSPSIHEGEPLANDITSSEEIM